MCFSDKVRTLPHRRASGQATVESAFLIPVVLLGMVLALQPGILLWNRLVMESAAAQGCRVAETLEAGKAESVQEYVERRLAAVPGLDIFHARAWSIEVAGDASTECVSVRISHAVRPVPLVGAALGCAGFLEGGLIKQEAACEKRVRDEWVMRSEFGPDMRSWQSRWEDSL